MRQPLQAIETSLLEQAAGGDQLFVKPTDGGASLHVLTTEAENNYNQCSAEAKKSWFRPFKQIACNWAVQTSLEENKIGEIKRR